MCLFNVKLKYEMLGRIHRFYFNRFISIKESVIFRPMVNSSLFYIY